MAYYDGNTVTALWNYAQRFSMSDNFFATTFGGSTPAHINLISGQTHGAIISGQTPGAIPGNIPSVVVSGTIIGNPQPRYDDCSVGAQRVSLTGKNIGDLLTSKNITWGWFQGGYTPSLFNVSRATCDTNHTNMVGQRIPDYTATLNPFQFYLSTSNPHHFKPSSSIMIGHTDRANHQYDLSDFWIAAKSGGLPAVSFIKAPSYQDGHPGYSTPLDEQTFLVNTINRLQQINEWKDLAIIITYDDSDGWYDHVMPAIGSRSDDSTYDAIAGNQMCGHMNPTEYRGRCGYGPRLPTIIISPWSRTNFVDHYINDHSSILRFIEDNWGLGRIGHKSFDVKAGSILNFFNFRQPPLLTPLLLDPRTGLDVNIHKNAQAQPKLSD
jgi:phospholipase C